MKTSTFATCIITVANIGVTAVFAQDKLPLLPPDDPETRAKLNDTQLLFVDHPTHLDFDVLSTNTTLNVNDAGILAVVNSVLKVSRSHVGGKLFNLVAGQDFLGDSGENVVSTNATEDTSIRFKELPDKADPNKKVKHIYKGIPSKIKDKFPVNLWTDGRLTQYFVDTTKVKTDGLPVIKDRLWYPILLNALEQSRNASLTAGKTTRADKDGAIDLARVLHQLTGFPTMHMLGSTWYTQAENKAQLEAEELRTLLMGETTPMMVKLLNNTGRGACAALPSGGQLSVWTHSVSGKPPTGTDFKMSDYTISLYDGATRTIYQHPYEHLKPCIDFIIRIDPGYLPNPKAPAPQPAYPLWTNRYYNRPLDQQLSNSSVVAAGVRNGTAAGPATTTTGIKQAAASVSSGAAATTSKNTKA